MKNYRQFLSLLTAVAILAACSTPEEKAVEFYESGQSLLEAGDTVKARLEFQNALQLNQNLVPAWFGLAEVAESNANWDEMYSILRNILEMDSSHLQAQIKLGQLLLGAGQLEESLEVSDRTMALAPENPDVLALRAAVFLKLGDMFSAIDFAHMSLEIDPQNIDAITVLASERLASADITMAIEYLDQGLIIEPENVVLLLLKIEALTQEGEVDAVEGIYQALISSNPDIDAFRHALASFYLQYDRQDDAEQIYRNIVQANPDDIDAKLNVIRMVNTVRGMDAAIEEMQNYVEGEPANMDLRFVQVQLYLSANQVDMAEQTLQTIISDAEATEDRLNAKGQLALLKVGNGDVQEANILVAEILAEEPRNEQALLIKADQEIQARNLDTAINDLRTILRDSSESPQALRMLGRAHELASSTELADDVYERAFRASQRSPEFGFPYAEFLVRHDRLSRAATILEEGLRVQPDHIQSLSLLVRIRMSLGEWAQVDELGSRIRALENSGAEGQRLLGTIYAGQQNYDESIAAFEQVYQSSPSDIQSMSTLVSAYVADGRTDQAMEFLDTVLAQNEDNSNVRVIKGQLLQLMNQIEDAEKEFSEAIRRQPSNADAYANLARLTVDQGQMDEALEVLDSGLAELPENYTLNIMKANLLEAQNDIEGAIAIYEELIQSQPNSDLIANNLASLLSDYRDDEASHQRALELAIRFRNSVIPNFQDTLGWVYFRLGDAESALSLLEDAVSAIPDFYVFRYHLGMAHKALGDNAEARTELEKALELAGDSAFPFRDEVEKAIMEL